GATWLAWIQLLVNTLVPPRMRTAALPPRKTWQPSTSARAPWRGGGVAPPVPALPMNAMLRPAQKSTPVGMLITVPVWAAEMNVGRDDRLAWLRCWNPPSPTRGPGGFIGRVADPR